MPTIIRYSPIAMKSDRHIGKSPAGWLWKCHDAVYTRVDVHPSVSLLLIDFRGNSAKGVTLSSGLRRRCGVPPLSPVATM